jgi:hypothetical protein
VYGFLAVASGWGQARWAGAGSRCVFRDAIEIIDAIGKSLSWAAKPGCRIINNVFTGG